MHDLLTNITGLDMALCLALLMVYVWCNPRDEKSGGLDMEAVD